MIKYFAGIGFELNDRLLCRAFLFGLIVLR